MAMGKSALERRVIPKLTVLVRRDEDQYQAYCPELDLVVAQDTPEEALEDLVELAQEYAEDYLAQFEVYSVSPNRAQHKESVEALAACRSGDEVKALFAVRSDEALLPK